MSGLHMSGSHMSGFLISGLHMNGLNNSGLHISHSDIYTSLDDNNVLIIKHNSAHWCTL